MKIGIKPLTCEAARELMFDYIDGQLKESDSKRLLSHISECEACKRELAERQEMLALIGSSATAAPEVLFNRVMEGIENIPQEKPNIFARFRTAYSVALVAACVVLTVLVVGRGYFLGGDNITSDAAATSSDGYSVPARGIVEAEADGVMFDQTVDEEILYSADVSDDVIAEIEIYNATTAAVTAAAPEIFEDYTVIGGADYPQSIMVEAAKKSIFSDGATSDLFEKFDLLYDKISSDRSSAAVIICAEDDISHISASFSEEINVSRLKFTRHVIEEDAARCFTEYLELLDKKNAPYRAAVPSDGDVLTCEIFLLQGEE